MKEERFLNAERREICEQEKEVRNVKKVIFMLFIVVHQLKTLIFATPTLQTFVLK